MGLESRNNGLYNIVTTLGEPKSGKVREVYPVEDMQDRLLFVASDRISAYDYIMPNSVPGKGKLLNSISDYWLENTKHIIDNHKIDTRNLSESLGSIFSKLTDEEKEYLIGRSMVVKKATTLPVEFIVRGYLAGSGYSAYKKNGDICGVKLPAGLSEYEILPEPIFTPSTKAESGHDENINYNQYEEIIAKFATEHGLESNPKELALELKNKAIELYRFGAKELKKKNILLADTKFEFGLWVNPESGKKSIILIDEVLTPDSSRFWEADPNWEPGTKRLNYDKQLLRDWLTGSGWDKNSEPPHLPESLIQHLVERYKKVSKLVVE
ncbi:MAG: phosphoribosylaminoimidazolesuccinocarboxamide synthase [Candidatus Kapaibacteriales bacterium]